MVLLQRRSQKVAAGDYRGDIYGGPRELASSSGGFATEGESSVKRQAGVNNSGRLTEIESGGARGPADSQRDCGGPAAGAETRQWRWELMNLMLEKGHSKVPFYYEQPTNIIGLILVYIFSP